MKKILFAIDSLSGGGAERVTLKLASYFADTYGYNIAIAVMHHTNSPVYEYSSKIRIIYIEDIIKADYPRVKYLLYKLISINKIIRKEHPDAFVSLAMPELNNYFVLNCKVLKIGRVILSERNDPVRYPVSKISRFLRILSYHLADAIVFQTEGARKFFSNGIRHKGIIISNPIKDNLPEPYVGKRKPRVVTFCRFDYQKNIPLLIDAFDKFVENHSEYMLDIYGQGVLEKEIRQYINTKKSKDKIVLHPFCTNVHEKIIDATMYVLSSDYEGVSNAMLEAMSIGIPVICTDSPPGGAREFIRHGENGFLTPVGDVNGLVSAMKKLAENEELQKKFSENGALVKNSLLISNIAKQWKEIIWGKE